MPPLSNMAVRDIETVVHPYTNLARHREVGPLILNEGKGIWGTWEIDATRGGFHIWPEGMGDPTAPALEAEAEAPAEPVGEPVTVG